MGMVVQHNMTAMNANRNLGVTAGNLAKSTEKLSSGYKINRAGDNAAGLAISEKMRGQIRGLDQASTNSEDGISMIQTAEGALTETHSILQRMRELSVQASSDTNTDDDRTQIQNEIDQLTQEVDRIATTTEFNTKKLLDGSRTGSVTEKAGKANVEGTFGNSNVSASITNDGSAKAGFTDVIRVEITEDFVNYGTGADGSKLDIDNYKQLATDIASEKSQVDKLQTLKNQTGLAGTTGDSLIKAYVNATKGVLLGSDEAQAAQTDAWKNIVDQVGALDASESITLGKTTVTGGSAATVVVPALKDVLDDIAKKEVEMETNETYQKFAAIEVDDLDNPGVTKALSDIMTNMSSDTAEFTKVVSAAKAGGEYKLANTASNVEDLAKAYKDALKVAYKDGVDIDDAKAENVVNARDALQAAFATDLKNTAATATGTGPATGTVIDGLNVTNGTTRVDEVAGAAFDDICKKATELAKTELMQEEALSEIKTGGSFTVTDLFDNSKNKDSFNIASELDADKNLKITLSNKEGDDTVITIANADKLLAGDVITITSEEMVETKSAATGREAFRLQVGANAGQEVSLGINSMKAKDLNIVQTKPGKEGKALDVTSQATASLAVNAYDMAIQKVSTERAKMGAMQNRLEHTIANLDTSSENLQSAESSLRDTDMAEEMTRYSKSNILQQAGQSMLAQANQSTQGVLSLLG